MKLFSFFIMYSFFILMFLSCSTNENESECYVADDCPGGYGCDLETYTCYEIIVNESDKDIPNITDPDVNEDDNPDITVSDEETEVPPLCGDGNRDSNEECDDGNNSSGDGCSSECKKEDFPDSDSILNDEDFITVPDEHPDSDNSGVPDEEENKDSEIISDSDINTPDTSDVPDEDLSLTCASSHLNCGLKAHCDDSSGTPQCVCDTGYQDQDGNGNCNPTCATSGINCNEPEGGSCFINSNGYAQCQCKTGYTSSYCNVCDYGYIKGTFPCEDECFEDNCWNATNSICGWLECSYSECSDFGFSGASCN